MDDITMFNKFSTYVTRATGSPAGFLVALLAVLVWGACGPVFHFSEQWQLVINTGTTIITFLMVFVIQHSQNKDTLALHLKMDELIKATKDARNEVAGIEEKPEKEIKEMKEGRGIMKDENYTSFTGNKVRLIKKT